MLKGMAQGTYYSAGHPNGCSFCEAINTVFITLLQHKRTKPISRYVSMKLTSQRAHGKYPAFIPWNPFLRLIKSSTVNEEGAREARGTRLLISSSSSRVILMLCMAHSAQQERRVCVCVCVCVHVCACVLACVCLCVFVCDNTILCRHMHTFTSVAALPAVRVNHLRHLRGLRGLLHAVAIRPLLRRLPPNPAPHAQMPYAYLGFNRALSR